MTGTDVPVAENQAAYIAGRLRHIRNSSAADVIRAAADAQKAADFLTGGSGRVLLFGRCRRVNIFAPGVWDRGCTHSLGSRMHSLARRGLAA